MAKKSIYDRTDKKLQRIAATVGAIMAILGAVTGVFSWVSNQFASAVASQISDFRQETKTDSNRHEQAVTRLELMILIEHDPENIAAIEKMARYYFQDLQGDLYMTQKFSEWAKQYGGDISIVVGVHS